MNYFDIKADWFDGLPQTAGWWLIEETVPNKDFPRSSVVVYRDWMFRGNDGRLLVRTYLDAADVAAAPFDVWESAAQRKARHKELGMRIRFSNFWPENPRVSDTRDHSKNGVKV